MDVWQTVAAQRHAIAAWARQLEAGDADKESWCSGWRVRDVLGHLVHLAEATQWTMARDIATHGAVPDRALARMARQLAGHPLGELADRLDAGAAGRFHVLGAPREVALGELLVHRSDMTRALGVAVDVDPDDAVRVLPVYRRVGRLAFHAPPAARVRLVATDTTWWSGKGPEVRGRAIDLLLLLANRRQVLPLLTGPGVDLL